MDATLAQLVDKIWSRFMETPEDQRFLVMIGGIPGSGKTTLSIRLTAALNAHQVAHGEPSIAAFLPMDGYHYTRAQLDAMPNSENAHARRGAEWTFDSMDLLQTTKALKEPLAPYTTTIYAPSFDHARKDPVENEILIEPWHRIVVMEGNYLLNTNPPWSDISSLASLKVFVFAPRELAHARLVARHLAAGLCATPAEANRRVVENDLVNGEYVLRSMRKDVDYFVESLQEGGWGGQ